MSFSSCFFIFQDTRRAGTTARTRRKPTESCAAQTHCQESWCGPPHRLLLLFLFLFLGSCSTFLSFSFSDFFLNVVLHLFFLFQHLYQSLTVDVSSVAGAPWRCGALTTQGGTAGIGLGRLLGGEHASTPQSGVEAPRLL